MVNVHKERGSENEKSFRKLIFLNTPVYWKNKTQTKLLEVLYLQRSIVVPDQKDQIVVVYFAFLVAKTGLE